jgi:hypothetical protein
MPLYFLTGLWPDKLHDAVQMRLHAASLLLGGEIGLVRLAVILEIVPVSCNLRTHTVEMFHHYVD